MLKPDLNEAKKRTKDKALVYTDKYQITDELKKLGINKKYFIRT